MADEIERKWGEELPDGVFEHLPGDSGHSSVNAESIKVISGTLEVALGRQEFDKFGPGESIHIPAGRNYSLRVQNGDVAQYKCEAVLSISDIPVEDGVKEAVGYVYGEPFGTHGTTIEMDRQELDLLGGS